MGLGQCCLRRTRLGDAQVVEAELAGEVWLDVTTKEGSTCGR